ncbi:efflux RND transporter periplasmic adaptor subunit [Chlamydiota bacterium]
MKRLLLVITIIAFFGIIIYMAVYFLFFREEQTIQKVPSTFALKRDIKKIVRGTGIVVSKEQAEVITKLPGVIEDFTGKVGDKVERDAVLFTISNDDIGNEFNIAKAEYDKASRELDKLKVAPDEALILEAKNGFKKAEVSFEEIQESVTLKRKLYAEGFISKKEFEDLENKLEFSKNEYEIAKRRLEEATLPPTKEEIDLAEAKLKKLQIQLDAIQEKVAAKKVTAPITGIIVDVKIDTSLIDRGEEIPAGTLVLSLANFEEDIFVSGEVYESDINDITVGQKVELFFSQDSVSYTGKISEVSLVAKAFGTVRKFPIEIEITSDVSSFIKLGMRVNFEIIVMERINILTIPLSFINTEKDGKKVWIKQNDTFVFIPIKTGISDDNFIEILSGLEERQKIFLYSTSGSQTGDIYHKKRPHKSQKKAHKTVRYQRAR